MRINFNTIMMFLAATLCACETPIPKPEIIEVPVSRINKEFVEFSDGNTLELPPAGGEETLIVLIRHAEKKSGDDPLLTEEGEARAERFANIVAPAKPDLLFSTPFRRNIATLGPMVQKLQINPVLYEPDELGSLATELKGEQYRGSRVVVCGHSNTVPALANLLVEAEHFDEIPETDYTRMYLIIIKPEANAFSSILKF